MPPHQLDRYARDARAWRDLARINHAAAGYLFMSDDPRLLFPPAILAHHALEMFLKSALIGAGMTVFNPVILKSLGAEVELRRTDCIWGHSLLHLSERLAEKRREFSLHGELDIGECRARVMLMGLREAFAFFDPFHSHLSSPQNLQKVSVRKEDRLILEALVARLEPFVNRIK